MPTFALKAVDNQHSISPAAGSEGCSEARAKAEAVGGRVQRLVSLLLVSFSLAHLESAAQNDFLNCYLGLTSVLLNQFETK